MTNPLHLVAHDIRFLCPQAVNKAYDTLNGSAFQEGTVEIRFEWDVPSTPLPGGG